MSFGAFHKIVQHRRDIVRVPCHRRPGQAAFRPENAVTSH